MAISIQPVGLTAAATPNELRVLAVIKERLCNSFCINADMLPQATVDYQVGAARLVENTIYIPVKAIVSVISKGCGCRANSYLFNENFVIAFADATALPTAVTLTVQGHDVAPAFVNCNRANGLTINDSLLITITPATPAAAN